MRKFLFAALFLVVALDCRAAQIMRYFESPRALGMGGAFTAVANDENALFYNPAGLTGVEKWNVGLINPMIEANQNSLDFYKDFSDIDSSSTDEMAALLKQYIGVPINLRFAIFPHFVKQNFALGIMGRTELAAVPHNPPSPEMQVDADVSAGGHLGWAHKWGGFSAGLGLKYLSVSSLNAKYEAADLAAPDLKDKIEDDLLTDQGFGIDVGLMYQFDVLMNPTIAFAAMNALETGASDLDPYKRHYNVGFALSHKFFDSLALTGALDFIDVTKELGTDEDLVKRMHAGLELKLPFLLSVRAGLNQGYSTFGATLDLYILKVIYAHYYEEVGTKAGEKLDERQVVQVSLGF